MLKLTNPVAYQSPCCILIIWYWQANSVRNGWGQFGLVICQMMPPLLIYSHWFKCNLRYISSGSDPNKPCVFPFIFMEETFNSCTTIYSEGEVVCHSNSLNHDLALRPGVPLRWTVMEDWRKVSGVFVLLTVLDVRQKPVQWSPPRQNLLIVRLLG